MYIWQVFTEYKHGEINFFADALRIKPLENAGDIGEGILQTQLAEKIDWPQDFHVVMSL